MFTGSNPVALTIPDMLSPSASRRLPHRFDPVGRCIYCGAEPPVPLTTEHIIPQGLGGGLILPSASCDTCRIITQKIEERCLRWSLLPYRLLTGLVQRPHEISEKVRQAPRFLLVPVFSEPPGILIGLPPGRPIPYHFMMATNDTNVSLPNEVNLRDYVRMVAKIAHSYAVAQLGFGAFASDLPKIIIDDVIQIASHLIGRSDTDLPVPRDALSHQLGMELVPWGSGNLVRVRMRLFAYHNSPAYEIIAGRLMISADEFDIRIRERTQ